MDYNFIEYSLETHLDSLFDFTEKSDIIEAFNTIKFGIWEYVFDEVSILYLVCMMGENNDMLTQLGFTFLKKYILNAPPLSPDMTKEEYHVELKKYILEKVTPTMMEYMIDKYIDKSFDTVVVNMCTYEVIDEGSETHKYSQLFTAMDRYADESTMLRELAIAGRIRIVCICIKLVNGMYSGTVFQNTINDKKQKILTLYNKYDTVKSFSVLSKMWSVSSDFFANFNYQHLSQIKLTIPFYPVSHQTQYKHTIPIFINNSIEVCMSSFTPNFIILVNKDKQFLINQEKDLLNVYLDFMAEKEIRMLTPQIQSIKKLSKNTDKKVINAVIKHYFNQATKNSIVQVTNFIKHLLSLEQIKIEYAPISREYKCIHENLIAAIETSKSIAEHKRTISRLAQVINESSCSVCGQMVMYEFNEEEGVMSEPIENMSEYVRLADFIRGSQFYITKLGRIFGVPTFEMQGNIDHKNFLIKNVIEIVTQIKTNEGFCKKFVDTDKSQIFIFSLTNNMYVQEYSVDKFIYKKQLNLGLLFILLMIAYYTIIPKLDFNPIFSDKFRPILENMQNQIGITVSKNLLGLFIFIVVFALKYKLYYTPELNQQLKLKDRVLKYGSGIFQCITDYVVLMQKLSSIGLLVKQTGKLLAALKVYRGGQDNLFISKRYNQIIKQYHEWRPRKFAHRLNSILSNGVLTRYMPRKPGDNCKYFCQDGKPHELKKGTTCTKCGADTLTCQYDVSYKCEQFIKHMKITEEQQSLQINEEHKRLSISIDNIIQHTKYLLSNVNANRDNVYTRISLRRDVIKIVISGRTINLINTSAPITMQWIGHRLVNSEFADTKVVALYTNLGTLFFNNYKTILEFKREVEPLAVVSVTNNIIAGKRETAKNTIALLYNALKLIPTEKRQFFSNTVPLMRENDTEYCECILDNKYNDFMMLLITYVHILSVDMMYLNSFTDKLNNYISSLKIDAPFFRISTSIVRPKLRY